MHPELLFLASLLALAGSQNSTFCSEPYHSALCSGNDHIACSSYFSTIKKCPGDVKVFDLTPLQSYIVRKHNGCRHSLAGGTLKNENGTVYDAACKMTTVQWDDGLAYFAQSNANTCVFAHSKCRKSREYEFAGENIAWASGYPNHTKTVDSLIDSWWNEYKIAIPQDCRKYKTSGGMIGHFTAMAQDKCNRIGCGCVTYNNQKEIYLVCVYGYTNVRDTPVYKSCPVPAQECSKGKNPDFPNLCAVNEPCISSPYA